MIRRPPRSTRVRSSAASDVYKRQPSKLGDFSYEIEDTKLARTTSAKFILQLCLYSEMLAEIQGVMPKHIHVVLGDGRKETFILANYLRYYRQIQKRFLAWVTQQE